MCIFIEISVLIFHEISSQNRVSHIFAKIETIPRREGNMARSTIYKTHVRF